LDDDDVLAGATIALRDLLSFCICRVDRDGHEKRNALLINKPSLNLT